MLRQDQAVALAKESLLTLYGYKDVKCSACYYELDQNSKQGPLGTMTYNAKSGLHDTFIDETATVWIEY